MNKALVLIVSFLLLVSVMTPAQEKTYVTAGLSWWNAQYSYETEEGNKIADIGTGNMFGPYLSVSHGKFNFGASLFWGSFPVNEVAFGGTLEDVDVDFTMSRGDLNFTVGYRVSRYINLFLGSKFVNFKIDGNLQTTMPVLIGYDFLGNPIYDDQVIKANLDWTQSGPTFGGGVSGVVPFGATSHWYGFGSLALLFGNITNEVSVTGYSEKFENEISSNIVAVTLGVGYRAPSGLGVNLGYRADLYSGEVKDQDPAAVEEKVNTRVEGLILTLSYSF